MPHLALKSALGLALAALCLLAGPGCLAWAQYDGPTAWEMESAEYEALVEALDEFGLEPDNPELEGLDNGELWRLIEERQAEIGFPSAR